jgi:hypothetical protein
MSVIEIQTTGKQNRKIQCDFCNEEPENGVLIEKPNSMIINGQMIVSHRKIPLHICLDCLNFEIENM